MASSSRGAIVFTPPSTPAAIPSNLLVENPGLSFAVTIPGLTLGLDYFVKVSCWNGVGNEWGIAFHSVPALATPLKAPSGPASVLTEVLSDRAVKVEWEAPAALGGSDVQLYRVEWDGNGGVPEVQLVTLSSVGALSGTFQLAYGVQKTRPLQYAATEEQVTAALEALASVGRVNVALSTSVSSSGANNRMWSVTFLSNIGNLPSLVPIKDLLVGESASLTVSEVTAGTEPSFDQGTVGVDVMPLGFKDIEPLPEIQTIIVTSGAEDLDGDFKMGYRGAMKARPVQGS
jgi:hypothetical protein